MASGKGSGSVSVMGIVSTTMAGFSQLQRSADQALAAANALQKTLEGGLTPAVNKAKGAIQGLAVVGDAVFGATFDPLGARSSADMYSSEPLDPG